MKILVYPKDPNPYQESLYSALDSSLARHTYLNDSRGFRSMNLILLPFKMVFYRVEGYALFHLHWTYGFTFPGNNIISKLASTIYYYFMLTYIRLLGYKIVWTVHNVLPHNPTFLNDIAARKYLAWITSAKIVHSSATIDDMKKIGLNTDNCHVIPMGSYASQYPNTTTREESRRKLGIKSDTFVYLHFGRLEEYKGIRELLSTFKELDLPNCLLLVAGKCNDPELKKYIHSFDKLPNIQIVDQFIPDEDVQYYFRAADMSVFPFRAITSSSSNILSLSFGVPSIFPDIGNLKDIPENLGYRYEASVKYGLESALKLSLDNQDSLKNMRPVIQKYLESLDWSVIAKKTADLYTTVTASP